MTPAGHPLFGSIIAIIGAFAYGFNIPAARVAGLHGVNGSNIAMQRGLLFIAVIFVFFVISGRNWRINPGEGRKVFWTGMSAGATAIGYLSALNFVPVGIAVAMFYLFPFFIIVISALKNGTGISLHKIIAFLIAFTGILLCVGPSFEQLDWRGLALALAAAFSCAMLFLLTASVKQDSLTLIFWIQLYALLLIIPVAWSTGFTPVATITVAWLPITISALGFYIGFACQVMAGSRLHPATLGLIFLIEPVVAILTAILFLDETMMPLQYLGMALVLAGLLYDMWRQRISPSKAV